jgi:hypothetical protein
VTVKDSEALCVPLGAVPLTVTLDVPVVAVPEDVTVSTDDPPEVTLGGLNEALVPEGRPLADRLTDCAEPLVTAVLMVEVPLPPCVKATDDGLTEIEKLFPTTGLITKVTVVGCVPLVPVPLMISGYVPAAAVPEFKLSVEELPAVMLVGLKEALAPDGRPLAERLTD